MRTDVPLPGAAGYPYNGHIGFDLSSENRFFPRYELADILPAGSTMTALLEFRFGDGTATAPAGGECCLPLAIIGHHLSLWTVPATSNLGAASLTCR